MKKFKKITALTASALLAFLVSACDKPANDKADAPKTEQAAQTPASPESIKEYKDFVDFTAKIDAQLGELLQTSTEAIRNEKDSAKRNAAASKLASDIETQVIAQYEKYPLKTADIQALRDKLTELLKVVPNFIAEQVKVPEGAQPTPEQLEVLKQSSQKINQLQQEISETADKLTQKYLPEEYKKQQEAIAAAEKAQAEAHAAAMKETQDAAAAQAVKQSPAEQHPAVDVKNDAAPAEKAK